MNKVIIIGNGFDLAHGLKTSYNHFIDNYLVNESSFFTETRSNLYKTINEIKEIKDWVDIENQYFRLMLKYIDLDTPRQVNLQFIKHLNDDLHLLKSKLLEYLTIEQERIDITPNEKYLEIFLSGINKPTDDIIIINFNYTDTAERYHRIIKERIIQKFSIEDNEYTGNIHCFNIHGQLNSNIEEPIFGIGDEYHIKYKHIKELDDIDEILKFSKSFWYQKNDNYQRLMNILDSYKPSTYDGHTMYQDFTVEILGHSCGLSDRTLLKNILENDSIKSIILYYYPDKNAYIKKIYDIWRHFDDPHQFRMKLKPYDEKYKMPQINTD